MFDSRYIDPLVRTLFFTSKKMLDVMLSVRLREFLLQDHYTINMI